jgi:hypothetical protein
MLNIGYVNPIGGLAGYPFSGTLGLSWLLDKTPNGGGIVIVYGSHVGVSPEGKVGYVRREQQANDTTSCGAAIYALG